MIIQFPKITTNNLYHKIEYICEEENIPFTLDSINTLLFVSDKDIRQAINNLECIYYSFGSLSTDNIYKLIDKPRLFFINNIVISCMNNNYKKAIDQVTELYKKGYTPHDILLTFMKFLFEECEYNINIPEEIRFKMYEIVSTSYMRINEGGDTFLQLCGAISKIFIFLHE
jgi:replication factor C subunit 2/4